MNEPLTPSPEEVRDLLLTVQHVMRELRGLILHKPGPLSDLSPREKQLFGWGLDANHSINRMLERLPPKPPMSPDREKVVGRVVAAALNKRFGDGTQEDVDQAVDAWLNHDEVGE